jgi:predicted metallo-beta-lactamase superfamily hydrolase
VLYDDHAVEVARLEKERDEFKARIKDIVAVVISAYHLDGQYEAFPEHYLIEVKRIAEGKL